MKCYQTAHVIMFLIICEKYVILRLNSKQKKMFAMRNTVISRLIEKSVILRLFSKKKMFAMRNTVISEFIPSK